MYEHINYWSQISFRDYRDQTEDLKPGLVCIKSGSEYFIDPTLNKNIHKNTSDNKNGAGRTLAGGGTLTFFLSSEPFFRSLLAMITPIRRVSNTGSVRFDCAADQMSSIRKQREQDSRRQIQHNVGLW